MDSQREWSEYWRASGAEGEVFVDAQGRKQTALADHWARFFEDLTEGARIIDVAAGAGSVFASMRQPERFALTATDAAPEALARLAARLPEVATRVCDAAALPFADGAFDAVVSQFGIEYAGAAAFVEAARLVAPGGHLACVTHVRGGGIDARSERTLLGVEGALDSGFVDAARSWIAAAISGDEARLQAATADFRSPQQRLSAILEREPEGQHAHLYRGFEQLATNFSRHDPSEVVAWLDANEAQLLTSRDRLRSMRDAAASEADMEAIGSALREDAGLTDVTLSTIEGDDGGMAVAWWLVARRP